MAFNWNKFPWTNFHDLNLDWIIQTVKQLENKVAELGITVADAVREFTTKLPATVQDAITEAFTGNGDLTINKTGDVRISGNSVQLSGTVISDTSEQLTLHNPNSKKSMTANYNSGVLTLTNNQDLTAGVAVYPINTPADGGGDNSEFAANVGYVKGAVAAVDAKLDTEISNRTSGDAALRSTINELIMPLINALQKRAPRVFYFSSTAEPGTLTADEVSTIKTALIDHTPTIFIAPAGASQYYYYCVDCTPKPNTENINSVPFAISFRTLDGLYSAGLTFSGAGGSGTVIFDTIS